MRRRAHQLEPRIGECTERQRAPPLLPAQISSSSKSSSMQNFRHSLAGYLLRMAGLKQGLDIFKGHGGSDHVGRRKNVGVAIGFAEDIYGMADLVLDLLGTVIFQALIVDATAEGDLAAKTAAHFIDVQGGGLHGIEDIHAQVDELWNDAHHVAAAVKNNFFVPAM